MSKKLTRSELIEAAATIHGEMVGGSSETDIMDILGLDAEQFREARKFMLEMRADEIRGKPREHVYIEYTIKQEQNIKDLNTLISQLDDTKQHNAVVGAIRLRSDILDKIIERGQEFGLLRREPQRKEIVAGVMVAEMATPELRKAIVGEIGKLNDLVKRFGDGGIMAMEPGPLHYGEPALLTEGETMKPRKAEGKAKAKTSRRAGGRRRVREASS
jgi:hypothetical protein